MLAVTGSVSTGELRLPRVPDDLSDLLRRIAEEFPVPLEENPVGICLRGSLTYDAFDPRCRAATGARLSQGRSREERGRPFGPGFPAQRLRRAHRLPHSVHGALSDHRIERRTRTGGQRRRSRPGGARCSRRQGVIGSRITARPRRGWSRTPLTSCVLPAVDSVATDLARPGPNSLLRRFDTPTRES